MFFVLFFLISLLQDFVKISDYFSKTKTSVLMKKIIWHIDLMMDFQQVLFWTDPDIDQYFGILEYTLGQGLCLITLTRKPRKMQLSPMCEMMLIHSIKQL